MKEYKLFKIPITIESQRDILEKVHAFLRNPQGFFHIVSLNPEIMVLAENSSEFKHVLHAANVRIIDGVGVQLACRMLKIPVKDRVTGVDFMDKILTGDLQSGSRVLFLGGKGSIAEKIAECYQKKQPDIIFKGIPGIRDVAQSTTSEEKDIANVLLDFKPQIIFVAFGSPAQELWLWDHREQLRGIIGMGVGQGFDVKVGLVRRAHPMLRALGLEWLFRLVTQPWRWRRQLRLLTFVRMVLVERFK